MNWYYLVNGQQTGPVDAGGLAEQIAQGNLTAQTLVWCDGMANWQALGDVASGRGGPAGAGEAAAAMGGRGFCCQCGRAFAADQLVPYSGYLVCGACKPAFFQRLSEGALATGGAVGGVEYAGFWIRFAAKLVDGLILNAVNMVILIPFLLFFMRGMGGRHNPDDVAKTMLLFFVTVAPIQWGIQIIFTTVFLGKYAATPGKMVCGLKVIRPDGQRITYLRAFGRFWGEMLSGLTMNIGYLLAAFDDQKRALHDHICNTRVVRK